jgi:hypothetical protein
LSIISHSGIPVLNSQCLAGEIWDVSALKCSSAQKDFRHLEFKVAITPEEHLSWTGFN